MTDPSLEPIGAVYRSKVGQEATEPMRRDIRLLGAMLGDTVREQNGAEVFDLVERARVESFRVRRSEIDLAQLASLFEGIDITEMDPCALRRTIGMVFQRPVLFAGSVADNLRVADPHASAERLESALEQVGLDGSLLGRIGDDLSGGEAQRVCIARTLLTDPKVVLMDEPTSSLDPANRRAIESLARELADRGLGIMWVSHDHDQVARLADRLVVLRDGRRVGEAEAGAYLDDVGALESDGDGSHEDPPGDLP